MPCTASATACVPASMRCPLMFAAGEIDAPQLKKGSDELKTRLENVDAQLAAARAASAVANMVLAGDDLARAGRPAGHRCAAR